MSSKNKLIAVGVTLIILLFTAILLIIVPKVEIIINGSKIININYGEEYHEEGANAFLKEFTSKKNLDVSILGEVNTNQIGKYIITYNVKYKGKEYNKIRIVNVNDTEKPNLQLNKEPTMCKINNLVGIDANATDNLDGDITKEIKYNIKNNKIIIYVTDSSNNKTTIEKDLIYIDEEKPVITLQGDKTIHLTVGDEYSEPGYVVYDSCDGNLTSKVSVNGKVDNNIVGEYEITYTVKDSFGNTVSAKRNIIVSEKTTTTEKKLIYLTFDDGPGQYTEKILNILDSYNIKATFFVTNQFSKYQGLIKTEYEKGHTVGVHTYSHNIKANDSGNIYNTLDSYLNDFNKMKDIIIKQTGVEPKYFRFPGGTSNRRAKTSMTYIANYMKEQGYVYFDWHIDCGDTHKNSNKQYIINLVKSHLKDDGPYIILMHDWVKNTMNALPEIIDYAKKNGYTFARIDENTPLKQFKAYN